MYEVLKLKENTLVSSKQLKNWSKGQFGSKDNENLNIERFERHLFEDEVIILLEGSACLLTAGFGKVMGPISCYELQKGYLYRISKKQWHATYIEKDSKVVVVGRNDNYHENSQISELDIYDKMIIETLIDENQ